jgi:hypothetical protein
MSVKGDWSRVKDQKAYDATLDKIKHGESEGYCPHHVHKSMKCERCDTMLDIINNSEMSYGSKKEPKPDPTY